MSKHRPVFHQGEQNREPFVPHQVGEEPVLEPSVDKPSVVEQKPQKKEDSWNLITLEQQNGKTYLVTSDAASEGVQAFWRKTRVLSHHKWVLNGKWTDVLTHGDVLPQPIYFKEIK